MKCGFRVWREVRYGLGVKEGVWGKRFSGAVVEVIICVG